MISRSTRSASRSGGTPALIMVLWSALGVVVLTLAVVAVVALVRNFTGPGTPLDETPEPELRHRYARGDIDHEDHRKRLDDLRSG